MNPNRITRTSLPVRWTSSVAWLFSLAVVCLFVGATRPGFSAPGRRGAQVEVTAKVSARKISLNDVLVLKITVTTVVPVRGGNLSGGGYDEFKEPQMPHFNVSGTSTSQSTRVTFSGGTAEKVTSHTRTYNLRAKKAGKLRIGSAKVRVGGRYYASKPIKVTVVAGQVPAPVGPGQGVTPPADDSQIFVQVHTDKKSAYVGEQILLSWYAYHETQLVSFAPVRMPTMDDFLVEDVYQIGPHTKSSRQIINGKHYGVTPLYKKAVFAKKAGTLNVSPLEVKLATVRTRYQQRGPAAHRRSAPLQLEIKPLPQQGRPKGFSSGNVGSFTLRAKVDRRRVRAGEAVTLTVVVKGRGHPADLELGPVGEIEGFKVRKSEPKVEVEPGDVVRGSKTYEFVLIAVKGGEHEIPAFTLPYFDPSTGRYEVAKSNPIKITVKGDLKDGSGGGGATGEVNVLRRGIKPITRDVELSSRVLPRFYSTWVFRVLTLFPVALLLGFFLFFQMRARLSQETDAKRWRRARWRAKKRFRIARQKLQVDDRSGFFAEVSRVLLEILGERLGENVRGLTGDELESLLLNRGFEEGLAQDVMEELRVCDFARFAKAASSQEEMEETLKRVRKLVGRVQRTKPKVPEPGKKEGL